MERGERHFYEKLYNRKRKPWRNARHFKRLAGVRRSSLIPVLCGVIVLEGMVLAGRCVQAGTEEFSSPFRDVITIQRDGSVDSEPEDEYGKGREAAPLWPGETKERGFSIDWKDGKLRFWQKEESYRFEEP